MKIQSIFLFAGALVLIYGLMFIIGSDTEKERDNSLKTYCEMVRIHQHSEDKNIGWPDYKHIYDEECRPY